MRRKLPGLLLLARGWDNSSQLRDGVNEQPNNRYLAGLDSPMGTAMGCQSTYMREGRRIIGRPSWGQPQGFTVWKSYLSP